MKSWLIPGNELARQKQQFGADLFGLVVDGILRLWDKNSWSESEWVNCRVAYSPEGLPMNAVSPTACLLQRS